MSAGGILTLVLIAACGPMLLWLGRRADRTDRSGSVLAARLRYQAGAVPLAILVWLTVRLIVPDHGSIAIVGDLSAPVQDLGWLGLGSGEQWIGVLVSTGSIVVVVTAVVMWLQTGRGTGITRAHLLRAAPWAVLLAMLNATNEELIFRVALLEGLMPSISAGVLSAAAAALASGMLFGLPHWSGHPGGPVGALLAAFLGWLSATATLQTGGIAWAWILHVLLDVVILAIVLAVGRMGRDSVDVPVADATS